MKRLTTLCLLAAFVIAGARECSAIVWFLPVEKGTVPTLVRTKELRTALLDTPPLGGTATEGSWNSCTLYYRGTQASLQKLIDQTAKIEAVEVYLTVDRSGKIGRAEPHPNRPMPGVMTYQFSVRVSGMPYREERDGETVSIVVHKSKGIDPDKLRLPKSVKLVESSKPKAAK